MPHLIISKRQDILSLNIILGGDSMNSVWSDTVTLPHFGIPGKNLKTDVLIIGGGMAGVLCTYTLGQAGLDCILVEADRVANRITGNTTAKIT